MEVEIIKVETILPSSPTPQSLKNFKLSFWDQVSPAVYSPLILFYTTKDGHEYSHATYLLKLKTSLSEALTHFYPFAGKIKDEVTIECNDQGAEFSEARANFEISDILQTQDPAKLRQFLPRDIVCTEAATGRLLLVKATLFACGGLAIGVSISHKLADASTLSTFMKCWAGKSLGSSHLVLPEMYAASLYPSMDISMPVLQVNADKTGNCITKRCVISASKISSLKAEAASESVQDPTRVEAVTALIWKCAVKASRMNSKCLKPSVAVLPVNLRRRVLPPISENCIGNLVASFSAQTDKEDLDLKNLVAHLRKGKEDFSEKYSEKLRGENATLTVCEIFRNQRSLLSRDDFELFIFTSWCNFGLPGIDFGWGKPAWMSITSSSYRNCVILLDAVDGIGIEAWVILSEQDMALFEVDKELLEFLS